MQVNRRGRSVRPAPPALCAEHEGYSVWKTRRYGGDGRHGVCSVRRRTAATEPGRYGWWEQAVRRQGAAGWRERPVWQTAVPAGTSGTMLGG